MHFEEDAIIALEAMRGGGIRRPRPSLLPHGHAGRIQVREQAGGGGGDHAGAGENGFVHQLPGRMTWPNIVLRRGVTDSDALFDWVNRTAGPKYEANSNKLTRSTGAITALGSNSSRLRSWER